MAIPRISSYPLPTRRPENRSQWTLEPNKAVLLVHDMQSYFVNFYDPKAAPMAELVSQIKALINTAKAAGIPVVYTAQPAEQPAHLRALLTDFWGTGLGQADTPIITEIAPETGDKVYTKWRYSAFKRSSLLEDMQAQGRDQLIICGIYAHIGVLATALDAFMSDIKPFVVADAVADFSAKEQQQALEYVATRCGQVQLLQEITEACATTTAKSTSITLAEMQQAVADTLHINTTEVDPEENLLYLGLDSIRVMALVEQWRGQGVAVTLADLAAGENLTQWHDIIAAKSNQVEQAL